MIYNHVYDDIDRNMSCSNIGARKKRSINDNLFVIYGIINDVMKKKTTQILMSRFTRVAKWFDKLEYVNTAADLYNAGVRDEKFITNIPNPPFIRDSRVITRNT